MTLRKMCGIKKFQMINNENVSSSFLPCSNHQCFAWFFFQAEDVIAGDSMLDRTWNVGIFWSATDCNQNIFCGQHRLFAIFQCSDNGVFILEVALAIYVIDVAMICKILN